MGEGNKTQIMKAIIYAGIGLFSVATVYGLADYYSSQKKGELKKLYAGEEETFTHVIEDKKTAVLAIKNTVAEPAEVKVIAKKAKSTKKVKKSERIINMKNFSRARIPESIVLEEKIEEPVKKVEVIIPEKPVVVPVVALVEKAAVKEEETERKLSFDKFSRAPLKKKVKKEVAKN